MLFFPFVYGQPARGQYGKGSPILSEPRGWIQLCNAGCARQGSLLNPEHSARALQAQRPTEWPSELPCDLRSTPLHVSYPTAALPQLPVPGGKGILALSAPLPRTAPRECSKWQLNEYMKQERESIKKNVMEEKGPRVIMNCF